MRLIKTIIEWVLCNIMLYVIGSFSAADIDFRQWNEVGRTILSIISVAILCLIIARNERPAKQ